MKIWQWCFAIYVIFLVVSFLYRNKHNAIPPQLPGAPWTSIDLNESKVRMAYRDEGKPDGPILLLLHGSPMGAGCFNKLISELKSDYRLITPDLPGFGYSWAPGLPDLSVEAHAKQLAEFLQIKGLTDVKVIGYSMSGGVALHLGQMAPDRIESLVMLSAIGVQEHELLGDYLANHIIHGLQLTLLTATQELIPHFGVLDRFLINRNYARNFYETDQRPLRSILETWEKPMQIIHGDKDWQVPIKAAREHHRLVPQSQLDWVNKDGSHIVLMTEPKIVAGLIRNAQLTTDRAPERVTAAKAPVETINTGKLVIFYLLLSAAALVLIRLLAIGFSWKQRRLLLSQWYRLTRWEFWPSWAIYGLMIPQLVWLSLKHKSFTLFTAVNPAIPCGGFSVEPKLLGLNALEACGNVPAYRKVASIEEVNCFVDEENITYPYILKPDEGERGRGVAMIHSREQAANYLENVPENIVILAQAFVGGEEFGVFYYRFPNEAVGHIYAVTIKKLIEVTGNGKDTLEHLILADSRAVCMAPFFLKQLKSQLKDIPGDGEKIPLAKIGTHSRGAIFLDGSDLISPKLEAEIHRISAHFEGFYFGRYDLKAPSEEALKRGEGIEIIELNGVTSEATSMYDPKHSLFAGLKILRKQWQIAYEIGAQNRENGHPPATFSELAANIKTFRDQEKFEAPNHLG